MMPNRSALVSVTKVAMMMMILGTRVETAPTERGFVKASLTRMSEKPDSPSISVVPEKSSASNLSQHLKQWLLTTKPTGVDRTSKTTDQTAGKTTTAGSRVDKRLRISPMTTSLDKRAQMLKMISALEELHRTINSTLTTRITLVPRANGRNSGKKNKALPASEGGAKLTTVTPVEIGGTASRGSTDVIIPSSLTGRNFKKSLPPQPKKTNKRVCFWKYCSQN